MSIKKWAKNDLTSKMNDFDNFKNCLKMRDLGKIYVATVL